MWGFVLAFVAAICWGIAPVAAKMALHQVSPVIGMGVRSMIAACIVSAWLVATGHYRLLMDVNARSMTWLIIEAILATVVGDAFYFYALQHGQAGQVGLIMASSPLITLITAGLLLGEPLTTAKLIGAGMVMCGLLLIGK